MQPYYISTQPVDNDDSDQESRDNQLEEVNSKTREAIDSLRIGIFKFKKELYADIVSGDKVHTSADMGASISFHAIFLQILGYWIGLLDSSPVPVPRLKTSSETTQFKALTVTIKSLVQKNQDARTLVYSLLSSFSTGHPFDLGAPEKNDDDE